MRQARQQEEQRERFRCLERGWPSRIVLARFPTTFNIKQQQMLRR